MAQPNDFMKQSTQENDSLAFPPEIPTDRPSVARMYGMSLGSRDNLEVDRKAIAATMEVFPETVDLSRQNRQFLYRAVRFLARDVGITQFLDLGSGLPTDQNVHQVAQEFQPEARVVYVDNDPIVLAHGRALLATDDSTTVIQADVTDLASILEHPETERLIDPTRPIAVLMFSVSHMILDDAEAQRAIAAPIDHFPSGSYLALSHLVASEEHNRTAANQAGADVGAVWKIRAPAEVEPWTSHLEPVSPGLGDILDWRPDPDQPPLPDPHPVVQHYLGASERTKRGCEYGGVFRKP